jgi:hypothetical protein
MERFDVSEMDYAELSALREAIDARVGELREVEAPALRKRFPPSPMIAKTPPGRTPGGAAASPIHQTPRADQPSASSVALTSITSLGS